MSTARNYLRLDAPLGLFLLGSILSGCLNPGSQLGADALFSKLPTPSISLSQVSPMIRGNQTYNVNFSAEAVSAVLVHSIRLQFSADGLVFNDLASSLAPGTTSYNWLTPAADIPLGAKLRLIVTDSQGNDTTTDSNAFEIRNRSPNFTQTTQPASVISKSNAAVTFGGSCENPMTVMISSTYATIPSAIPNLSNSATAVCSSGVWSYTASANSTGIRRYTFSQTDPVGHITTAQSAWYYDNTAPIISSVVLAGGTANVALPTVTVEITATDDMTGVAKMLITEDAAHPPTSSTDSRWAPFQSFSNYELSQVNGLKTVYFYVMDAAGNISTATTATLSLDFGQPPTVVITSPAGGASFSAGQSVPISWTCSSPNGLDAAPITNISYTTDDEQTFTAIPDTLNLSNANGSFSWTLPAGLGPFRLLISCKSKAGVVSTAYSPMINSPNWSIFMGDPFYGRENVTGITADLTAPLGPNSRTFSITADILNNIYFSKNNALMKMDGKTGVVSRFSGQIDKAGCTLAAGMDPLTGLMSNPQILGTDAAHQYLYVLSYGCKKIFRIKASDSTVELWNTLTTGTPVVVFLTQQRTLVYIGSDNYLYKLDLNSSGNTPVAIHGNGACSVASAAYPLGTDVTHAQLWRSAANQPCNNAFLAANNDASKVWLTFWGNSTGYRLDNVGSDVYQIGNAQTPFNQSVQYCISADFDGNIYCGSMFNTGIGRNIYLFDPVKETRTLATQFPFEQSDNTGNQYLGSMSDKLVVYYTMNGILTLKPSAGGNWAATRIAGQYLATMGNGNAPRLVGLTFANDIKYNTATQAMWVSEYGNARKIDFTQSSPATSTFFVPSFRNISYLAIDPTGTFFGGEAGCYRDSLGGLQLSAGAFKVLSAFLTGPCDNFSGVPYLAPSGTLISAAPQFYNIEQTANRVYHSSGKLYFSSYIANTKTDPMVFLSDQKAIDWVAGKQGSASYVASDSGSAALGASLTHVMGMQEILSGTYAGDLLAWDGDRLRRISVHTESSAPRIYDVASLSAATGYKAGTTISDFYYDQNSEVGGVLGSGAIYYAITNASAGGAVHKLKLNTTLNGGTDTAYDLTGTKLTGTVRLTLAPAGLMVLQNEKPRVLQLQP